MSTFGLDINGFTLKRLPDIKTELENAFQLVFGSIDVSGDSVAGQLIGILCKPITDIWELSEALYYSQYPDTADGVNLDYAVALTGLSRKTSTYSVGKIALHGDTGTIITGGSGGITVGVDTMTLFYLTESVTIQNVNILEAYLNVDVVQDSTDYVVELNSMLYTFNSGVGATAKSIASGIADLIDGIITVTDFGSGALYLKSTTPFSIDVSTSTIASWSTPAEVIAVNPGPVIGPVGAIINIVNPIVGLDSVINYEAVTTGEAEETDTALRIRRIASLKILGAGNLEAIRARLLALDGVDQAYVYENDTNDFRDEDGNLAPGAMPPHSIEALVVAEDTAAENLLIANTLWLSKPAGIYLFGSTSVVITDSQGGAQTIRFSRPYLRDSWFYLTITTNLSLFPVDGASQISNAMKLFGDGYGIGDDLIYQEFYTQIYSIPGVLTATIKVMLPKVSYLLPATPQIATLVDLVTTLRTGPLGNILLANNDYFATLGTNDVAAANPDNLTTIKGSALAANDLFQITDITTPTIIYIGNLDSTDAAYTQPSSGYFAVSGNERAIFNTSRIKGL
jgi:uncharacterized phage protein gp47/JayE